MQKPKTLEYIDRTSKFGIDLSLDRISVLMDYLGNPQDKLKYVHIAGTNGKGSACAVISSILSNAGYKTGKFISPHLEKFNERITIDGLNISDEDIERLSAVIMDKIKIMTDKGIEHPTQFEIICAMAFVYFFERKCDIVVLEVGLGGRLDATNIIKKPEVSVITTIAYDHTDRLGNSIEKIAGEKAGIIKKGSPVVSAPQEPAAMNVIRHACIEKDCKLVTVGLENLKPKSTQDDFQIFDFEGYSSLSLGLRGSHQLINASAALKVIDELKEKGFIINDEAVYQGIKSAENIGRFEVLGHNPEFVIDGAHNISGISTLKDALYRYYAGKRIILVMAVLSVKDYQKMVDILEPLVDCCIVSEPVSESALPAEKLARCFERNGRKCITAKGLNQAVDLALEKSGQDDVICCCGSLYFIGHVRGYYLNSLLKNNCR